MSEARWKWAVRVALVRLRLVVAAVGLAFALAYGEELAGFARALWRPSKPAPASRDHVEYFCPMHAAVVRPDPGTCPLCGMALSRREVAPVPEHRAPAVAIDARGLRLAGITTVAVQRQSLRRTLEAFATIEADERRTMRVATRFKGRVETVYVQIPGTVVRKGQPLLSLQMPELIAPGRELIRTERLASAQHEAVRRQLTVWGLSERQIALILSSKDPTHLPVEAPMAGTVLNTAVVPGDLVMEGAALYTLADLGSVWALGKVHEDDVALVRPAEPAEVHVAAFPGRSFPGTVVQVDPVIDRTARTATVRIQVQNPALLLRPGMTARVALRMPLDGASEAGLAIPATAVLDQGAHRFVWREAGPGLFEPVEIGLGPRCGELFPVLSGLSEGDRVAAQGAFVVDAEFRLHPATPAGAGAPEARR